MEKFLIGLRRYVLIGLILTSSSPLALANEISFCPKNIEVSEQLVKLPPKWESFATHSVHFLNAISIYSGHPRELASLKPAIRSKEKSTWFFSLDDTIYIVCEYRDTGIQLTQKLPAKMRYCDVFYDLTAQGGRGFIPTHIKCGNNPRK
ncbi:STY0301 family protein [Legionella jamestowniensis]|uniref:STY0301 family protein n=1 Tax=Legionella jamestowniensis TaxID=455 RepID=UPI0009F40309|nr:STY0301 family protein [Legionella jamestowniensis]